MNKYSIQHLLSFNSKIREKYDAIAKISGEKFNVFKILKLESSEVRTHSAFIAELLNCHGSHGKHDVFLKLFIETQLSKQNKNEKFVQRLQNYDSASVSITIEKHIGYVSHDYSEGGRIDIFITNRQNRALIIENKIYAGDQQGQLLRYNKAYRDAPIFYLTLYGVQPSDSSKANLQEGDNYICISYKEDITEWLEACLKETAQTPLLRETILQYIYLIKYLTNQTMNADMKKEVADMMASSKENIVSAYNTRESIDAMERLLLHKLQVQLSHLAEDNNFICEFEENFGKLGKDTYLSFYLPGQREIKISIGFEKWRTDFSIGVDADKPDPILKKKFEESVIESVIGKTSCTQTSYTGWYYLHFFEERKLKIWDNPEVWCEIYDGTLSKRLWENILNIYAVIMNFNN